MKIKNNLYFWIILAIFIVLIFIFNSHHNNQQGIFYSLFRPLADNILNGKNYTLVQYGNDILFYPLWGYTFIVALDLIFGASNIFLLVLQAVLSLIGIIFFYKVFKLEPKYFHIPLFLPFIALMSVKWPDAIVGFLLIVFVFFNYRYFKSRKLTDVIIAGIILGLISNFRSEYLYLPIIQILFTLFPFFKNKRKLNFIASILIIIIAFICMLPWAYRSYINTGELRFSASNGGMVLYISLGQLPNNPWNIRPVDKTAIDFAESKGYEEPFSPSADKALTEAFKISVRSYPSAFLKKVGYNFLKSFIGGVYTGEYANFTINDNKRISIDDSISNCRGLNNKIKYIASLPAYDSIPIIIEKLIQGLFIPILFIFLIIFFIYSISKKHNVFLALNGIVICIVLYKLITISLIQYEYRHMNGIYIFILGIFLLFISELKRK